MLKHKARSNKPNSLKPLRLLPHWHPLPKWAKNLEGQSSESSSIMCAFLIIWVESNARIQWRILGGNQTILRIKDCKSIRRWRSFNKWSKQSNEQTNQMKDIMIRSRRVLWIIWGSSPRFVHKTRQFALKYKVHKHGIITPIISFKAKDTKWNKLLWSTQKCILNKMRKLPKVHA